MTEAIHVYAPPSLKRLVEERADSKGVSVSEMAVELMAKQLRRPELSVVPRKRMGRPRKTLAAAS